MHNLKRAQIKLLPPKRLRRSTRKDQSTRSGLTTSGWTGGTVAAPMSFSISTAIFRRKPLSVSRSKRTFSAKVLELVQSRRCAVQQVPGSAIYGCGCNLCGCNLRLSKVQFGSLGSIWAGSGPFGPRAGPKSIQTAPTGPRTISHCNHMNCSHIHTGGGQRRHCCRLRAGLWGWLLRRLFGTEGYTYIHTGPDRFSAWLGPARRF